ncbi:MAG: response regulator, partial [Candidatus Omnitrophota bacterium]
MRKNILVIDSDPLAQEMIAAALKKEEEYTVVASLNFEDALQKVRQTLPDLVLIDVVMPDITGFDA